MKQIYVMCILILLINKIIFSGTLEDRVNAYLSQMTLNEKCQLLQDDQTVFATYGCSRLAIPDLSASYLLPDMVMLKFIIITY